MGVTEQPKVKVGFKDTAMGSREPEVDVQDSIQTGDDVPRKKMKEDSLEPLGDIMYKEVVLEKEKISQENERLQAKIQRLRPMASSASTIPRHRSTWRKHHRRQRREQVQFQTTRYRWNSTPDGTTAGG